MKKLLTFGMIAIALSFGALVPEPAFAQQNLQNQLLGQVDNTGDEVFGQGAQNQGNLPLLHP